MRRVVDGAAGRVWRLRVERENLRTPALRERLQAAPRRPRRAPTRLEIEAGAVADTAGGARCRPSATGARPRPSR